MQSKANISELNLPYGTNNSNFSSTATLQRHNGNLLLRPPIASHFSTPATLAFLPSLSSFSFLPVPDFPSCVSSHFLSFYPFFFLLILSHQNTHTFNGPLSGTTQVSRYQKGKTNLDFTEARDSEWQWHQVGHMQICTSLQTNNLASTPPLSFLRPDALPAAQPIASKH